ncbi:glycosyltransferase family 2 protein [Knoellia sp. S7-12]|uniref:glycosyltransferase family 2 protein n=1 Tax=Knoellia sp. S7-12 TaxID=3126698 RepID=UPI003368BED4
MRHLITDEGRVASSGIDIVRQGGRSDDGHVVVAFVPAHNEADQIQSTIASLQSQTRPPELIVVAADNCTDQTVTIAQGQGVVVFETVDNTARKAGALNQAWQRHAHGSTHILTMDADTSLTPDAIENMLHAFAFRTRRARRGRPLGAACARYWAKDGEGLAWRLQRLEYARYDDSREMRGWAVQVASGAATLYRSDALDEVVAEFGREVPWDCESLIEDYALTLDLKTAGYAVSAAPGAQVLTDTPATFGELWQQRLRWGRGGIDECRKRGWIPETRRDIAAYGLFGVSSFMRLLWIVYVIALFKLGMGLTFSLIGMIPLLLMWLDRVSSAWRVPGRTWQDITLSATMLVEDFYGLFLEACTATALLHSIRRTSQAW